MAKVVAARLERCYQVPTGEQFFYASVENFPKQAKQTIEVEDGWIRFTLYAVKQQPDGTYRIRINYVNPARDNLEPTILVPKGKDILYRGDDGQLYYRASLIPSYFAALKANTIYRSFSKESKLSALFKAG